MAEAEKVHIVIVADKPGHVLTMADVLDFGATFSTISAQQDDDQAVEAKVNGEGKLTRLAIKLPGISERQE